MLAAGVREEYSAPRMRLALDETRSDLVQTHFVEQITDDETDAVRAILRRFVPRATESTRQHSPTASASGQPRSVGCSSLHSRRRWVRVISGSVSAATAARSAATRSRSDDRYGTQGGQVTVMALQRYPTPQRRRWVLAPLARRAIAVV